MKLESGGFIHRPVEIRFWEKVDKRGPDECWEWIGYKNKKRKYGYFNKRSGEKLMLAHRMSWELFSGNPIPVGMVVCHKCDNPSCVNPSHLFVGTMKDNMHDASVKGRIAWGERHGKAYLKEKDVLEMRDLKKIGYSIRWLSQKFKTPEWNIRFICNNITWKNILLQQH